MAAWPDLAAAYRPDDAGLLAGVYAFSENYCDTGLGSVAHLGSVVIPALLIGAQLRVVTGRDVLAAIAVGYNVMEYLGATVNGGRPRIASQLKGFRPTASAGPVAAVAVLARLAGLSPQECRQALALGCSQGGGLRRSPIAPTAAIRIQSGEAVRRAVQTLRHRQVLMAGKSASRHRIPVTGLCGFCPAGRPVHGRRRASAAFLRTAG